jgi:hypothetical protein
LTDGILPAAGLASRMRGLPKFLLPCDENYTTLIERHIVEMLEVCEMVWIPTRPEQIILLESLGLSSDRVVIVPMTTQTMTQTVIRLCAISGAERFMMVMPDTYFLGEPPYEYLATSTSEMDLACWPIREEQIGKLGQVLIQGLPEGVVLESRDKDPNCKWPHSWGAMAFNRGALSSAMTEMPHTGYMIPKLLESGVEVRAKVLDGIYFDCGTPREYLHMLELLP